MANGSTSFVKTFAINGSDLFVGGNAIFGSQITVARYSSISNNWNLMGSSGPNGMNETEKQKHERSISKK